MKSRTNFQFFNIGKNSIQNSVMILGQGCHGTGKTGKTGNLNVLFSRQGKHREFTSNTGIKKKLKVKPGLWWNVAMILWTFDATFELMDNPITE